MAKYPSISQTKNGRILIAKSNATGKALVPIKVVTGDGQLTNQNIETMENVINPLLELPFASPGRFVKEGQFQLDFALSNEHLEHGFYAREIGVFAKLDGEDDSTAVMIAYTNGGNFVDYIPAKDTPINSKVFEVTIAVDNAASVVVQRSDAAYITAGEMEHHNADANAHDVRFNAIIQQLNNMITSVDNSASLAKAPTLQLVKTLLSSLNIKNATDVVKALESEKATGLGIRYDFSNVNAWYICLGKLFGNLIVQGGNNLVRGNRDATITLPISYSKFFIPVSNPEYDNAHKFVINMVSMYSGTNGLNKVVLNTDVWSDSDVDKEIYCWWLTVGI